MGDARNIHSAYSYSARSNAHYNTTRNKLNQFTNANILRLSNNYDQRKAEIQAKRGRQGAKRYQQARYRSVGQDQAAQPGNRVLTNTALRSLRPKSHETLTDFQSIAELSSKLDEILQLPNDELLDNMSLTIGEEPEPWDVDTTTEQSNIMEPIEEAPKVEAPVQQELPYCILSDPNCPPFSILDCWARRCPCHLCTCGLHICLAEMPKGQIQSKSAWKTSTGETYKKRGCEIPKRANEQQQIQLSKSPMAWETTNRADFIAKTNASDLTPIKNERPLDKGVRFVARSSYGANFPDWGTGHALENYSPRNAPYRGMELASNFQSIYQNSFDPKTKGHQLESMKRNSSVNFGQEFHGETEATRAFKMSKSELYNSPKRETANVMPLALKSPTVAFKTSNAAIYQGAQPVLRLPPTRKPDLDI